MTKKPRIACFDTQILSYLILKDPQSADFTDRSAQLMERLYDQEVGIIVPTLCVSELLIAFEPKEQNGIRAVIEQNFRLVTFDNMAAIQSARVYRLNKDSGQHAAHRDQSPDYPRQKLKVDHMIVGVAIANKVDMLYTNDHGLLRFAQGHVNAMLLPESMPKQGQLEFQ